MKKSKFTLRHMVEWLLCKRVSQILPDRLYLKLKYWSIMGKKLNLSNPITYNEKLQWLKLYDHNLEYTKLVDKYEVKSWARNKIGSQYIIKTLGIWNTFDEINFSELPNQFVLKCTHDSGGLVICKDKKVFDVNEAKKKINASLSNNYFYSGREWPYKNVKPRIIAEVFMEDEVTHELRDYKFFCFDGKVKALFVASERQSENEETKFDFFDEEYRHLPFTNGHPNADVIPKKPMQFDQMKQLAEILSEGLPHARIDLYEVNGKVYFGEITFSHWSGFVRFEPEEWDEKFGAWISLPSYKKEYDVQFLAMIKRLVRGWEDQRIISDKRKKEIAKFNDDRRKQIWQSCQLSASPKKSIDDFFWKNYGSKIPYTWHKHYTAFNGNFDFKYFPELLYIPEFEHFMNFQKEYVNVFENKNILSFLAKAIGVKTPQTIISVSNGMIVDGAGNGLSKAEAFDLLQNVGDAFIKPTIETSSGIGCAVISLNNGIDIISNEKLDSLFEKMGKDFAIQERVKCNQQIVKLHPSSVNTFRVITYRWKKEIRHLPVVMRIGTRMACVDNAHAGGIFVGVSDEGVLLNTAYSEFGEQFVRHPDTNVIFDGYEIENYKEVVDTAIKMHTVMPQIGVINWDFTIDEQNSPVLIEANCRNGSIWLVEMAHGKGAFGDNTAEILQWIRFMKKCPVDKRAYYAFGNLK